MSIIYPGNYVAQLNAYRGQGVEANPGVNYYSVLAVSLLEPSYAADGTISGYALGALEILSPDLRQDDKPRLNKPAQVPANSTAYYTAVTAVNIEGAGTETVTVTGGAAACVLTADADGVFPAEGKIVGADIAVSAFGTSAASDVTVAASAPTLVPSDTGMQAYVIVEVASAGFSAAPTSDDVHVPFKVEAGQGT